MLSPNTIAIDGATCRYGWMYFYGNDRFIGHCLAKYGEYSEGEPALWRRLIKPGQTVMDIGANIGALTLALSDIVGDEGKVIAFEAHPDNYLLLNKNVEKNTRSNIITINVALSDKCGELKLPTLESISDANYGRIEADQNGPHIVNAAKLDDECKDFNEEIAFIKIDVEGMEANVLRGAIGIIEHSSPILYVEMDREEKKEELIGLLAGMGYKMYQHLPSLYSPENFRGVEVSDPNIISLNVLCIPARDGNKYDDVTKNLRPVKVYRAGNKVNARKDWACVVRLGGIGDDLIAASTLRPLKKLGYMVEVISSEPQCTVFENNPFIDKLTIKAAKELPQDDQINWQKYWWSRSCEYAKFVNLSHSVEVLMAQFPASTAFWWPQEFRRKICGQSYLEAAHDVVGVPYEFGPLFFPTEAEQDDIAYFKQRHKLDDKPLIAWVISGTRLDKVYPYAGLTIARLITELGANVIMMSAPSPNRPDAGHAEQIMNHVALTNSSTKGLFEVRDIPGNHDWSIRRMLTLAMQSDVVIGPDTGVMWAVAMEQTGKVLLHSHASVDNITKHWANTISLYPDPKVVPCWPCHLLHDKKDTCEEMQVRAGLKPAPDTISAACISAIKVEPVLLAAKAVLENNFELVSNFDGSSKAIIRQGG